jgi:hypothetical protein
MSDEDIVDAITKEERERHRQEDGSIDQDKAVLAIAARLTEDQIALLMAKLRREADEDLAHADALDAYGARKFGVNDNERIRPVR